MNLQLIANVQSCLGQVTNSPSGSSTIRKGNHRIDTKCQTVMSKLMSDLRVAVVVGVSGVAFAEWTMIAYRQYIHAFPPFFLIQDLF